MKENGIRTSIHYPSTHTFTAYKDDMVWDLPVTEDAAKREITLPLYPAMSNVEVMVASTIEASLNLS